MEEKRALKTIDEIRAFSDPYRMQILTCLRDLGKPSTVKQIADEMGETPAKVHYHVKKLEKAGILRLSHTEEINGIIAKYYEITAKKFEINHDDIDPAIEKMFLNETQRMISSMYDRSKKLMLERLEKANESVSKTGDIGMTDAYLTEQEAMELIDMIHKFHKEHSDKSDPSKSPFHLFTAIMPMESK